MNSSIDSMLPTGPVLRTMALPGTTGTSMRAVVLGVVVAAGAVTTVVAPPAAARGNSDAFCSATALAVLASCRAELRDDAWIATGNCINVSDPDEREECFDDARANRSESAELCRDQYQGRRAVCELVGEERYDPDFAPENFVDPRDIGTTVAANPYFPLAPGSRWVYRSVEVDEEGEEVTETTTVVVTERTKLIEGVRCVVVNDLVTEDGEPIEDTDDWYAQDRRGNVWYCGEIAENFEQFEGDDPDDAELVNIDGSWKTGRDGAKPGILMLADPEVGNAYRQEISLGEAEDVAEVVSTTGDESVPAAKCDGRCLVTRDFTAVEPGVEERKFYARGIGFILAIGADGKRDELVEYSPR